MGSYLDKPETTKKSEFLENEFLEIGSSAMQGWRINQEDAHNAIPNLSDNVAFFGLYDGHGGSEVAEYCSLKLPEFLKQLESFKGKNYEKALIEAFMGFDSLLLTDEVLEELKKMAKNNPDFDESDGEDMEDEETAEEIINLHQEATMPLNEVLQKYKLITEKTNVKAEDKAEKSTDAGSSSAAAATCTSSSSSSTSPSSSSSNSKESNAQKISENQVTSSLSDYGDVPISSSTHVQKSDDGDISSKKTETNDLCEPSDKDLPKPSADISSSTNSGQQQNGQIASSSSTATSTSTVTPNKTSPAKTTTTTTKPSPSKPQLENDSSSTEDDYDEALDKTYKESPKKRLPNSDDESSEEDDEEISGAEEDDDEDEEASNEDVTTEDEEEDQDDDGLDDDFMNSMETGPGKASGCTAVVAVMDGRDLYVANAGDSRCVVCRAGKAVEMSDDHKPEDDKEYQRIRKAGGRVTMDGRVNGGLNLSRAIGDHGYKMNKDLPAEEQMITALPDLKKIVLEPGDEFMVLACDGIWNYMTNDEVVGYVKTRIDAGKSSLTKICEELFHNCLAPNTLGDGTGCDNMTAIIVKFKKTLFDLPTSTNETASNVCSDKVVRKRLHEADSVECDSGVEPKPTDKKQKIEEELPTPSTTVETS